MVWIPFFSQTTDDTDNTDKEIAAIALRVKASVRSVSSVVILEFDYEPD